MITGLNPTSQQLLNSINNTQADLNRMQAQISSGLRITRASDNPQLITDVLMTRSDLAQVTQVAHNLGAVKTEVDTADAGLQSAVQFMEQAAVLASQGANLNMTAQTRATLAQQVGDILQQVVTVSRTEVQGSFIFSGDQTSTPPYELDSASATGVKQLANAPATRLIQDTSGLTFAVSKTAQEIFDARDGQGNVTTDNVFAALKGLQTALLANDPTAIETAAVTLNTAHDYLNNQASFYGAVQNKVSTALDLAQKFQTQDQTRLSSLQDADIAAAALQMTQDTTHINAGLASAAKQITTSLFDYIK
jgi:flagellar hook-associated protein 3 FlgL